MGEFLATDKKQIMDIRMSQNQSYTQSSCFRQTSSLALIVVLLQVSKPSDHILKKNKRHHVTYLVVHAYAFNIRCEEACFQHCLRLALGLLNYWEFPKALAWKTSQLLRFWVKAKNCRKQKQANASSIHAVPSHFQQLGVTNSFHSHLWCPTKFTVTIRHRQEVGWQQLSRIQMPLLVLQWGPKPRCWLSDDIRLIDKILHQGALLMIN